jgi:hypothetical protein
MPDKSGTLREPVMLTPTEIYEKVTTHLLTQRAVSENQNGSCRLHGAQGRKCAVGSLVSDESYKPASEGIGISYYRNARDGDLLRALHASQVDTYRADIIDLLIELEQVHDDKAARVVRAGRSPRRPTRSPTVPPERTARRRADRAVRAPETLAAGTGQANRSMSFF